MSLRHVRFALVFLAGLPAQLPMQAMARPPRPGARPQPADPLQKWASSGYHYCDAKILGGLWGTDTFEAKKTVGRKLGWGNRGIVESELRRARKVAATRPGLACNYSEAGFSYADAEKLASIWRVDVAQAKRTIERKVLYGQEPMVRKLVDGARAAPGQPQSPRSYPVRSSGEALDAFFASGHDYCDAKVLGALWRADIGAAKRMGGHLLLGGGRKVLADALGNGRKLAMRTRKGACSFDEAGFSPADARALATLWRTDEATARRQAENKILWGGSQTLREMLSRR